MLKIITISGLDGSGKTTQCDLLEKDLTDRGQKVYRFHAVEFSLAQKVARPVNTGSKKSTSVTKSGPFKIWLRKIILRIDLFRFKRFLEELDSNGYTVLLSDRYFYDSLINIAYLADENWLSKTAIKKPDAAIYLKVSPEKIMKRKRKPDQGIDYLKAKAVYYGLLAREFDLHTISGNGSKGVVFKRICKITDQI